MNRRSRPVAALALSALLLLQLAASAQTTLPSADVASFLGTWILTLQSPQGNFEQTLVVKDAAGTVAAELSNQMQPTPTAITDIRKVSKDLLLKFSGDFQGTPFTATITLTPDSDDKAFVMFDVMDGQFVMQGSAVKK